ncbi:MAG TPA: type II toxin-antitoxin system VapC family toxin [Firmicutes bacterium]|nr:type II toxin-antitoxin system VapC family toxin [Candidatus Fermentithermobacillaceae bacterium]
MSRNTCCLDTSVLVKILVPEEGSDEAAQILHRAIATGSSLVAPSFAWAEVGTVLKKKTRMGLITHEEANALWDLFVALNINYVEDKGIPRSAWDIATRFGLPTLYDAAFLAVCEIALEEGQGKVEFWTADSELVAALRDLKPDYMRTLGKLHNC